MSEQDNVDLDTQNQAVDDTSVSDTDNNDNTDDSANDSDDVEQLKEQNKKLFERAKKAEGFVKDSNGNWVKKPKPVIQPQAAKSNDVQSKDEFSYEDIAVLVSRVNNKEDREKIKSWAKRENTTLETMLSDPLAKARLQEWEEQRKTAEVSNTSGSRRVTQKVSNETILENAQDGKLPSSDEDIARLAKATVQGFKKK